MVIAGDEEPIEVVASSFEEAADGTVPVRTRRLRLRTSDGSILDVAEDQRRGRWRVQSEIGPGEVQRAP